MAGSTSFLDVPSNIRSMYELRPLDQAPSSENAAQDQSASNTYSELFRAKIYQHYLLLEASGTGGLEGGLMENPKCSPTDFEDAEKLRAIMREKPFAIVVSDPFPEEKQDLLFQTYGDVRVRARRRLRARISRIPALQVFARWLVESSAFQIFILLVIGYNSITLGLQAEYCDRKGSSAAKMRSVLDCLDILALAIFMFEIQLKWMVNFRDFWGNPWNTFDFAITLFTFITTVIGILGNASPRNHTLEPIAKTMRAFQVLRLLRILTRSQGMKVIVFTVTRSLSDMFSILIVFMLFMYIFLVTGVIFLADMDVSMQEIQNGTFNGTVNMTMLNATDDTEVLLYGGRFRNLFWGFLTLYQIFTIDHWYAMLHNSWCKIQSPVFPIIFTLLWVLIGSLIFRNIFAGVVVNTFQALKKTVVEEDNDEEKELSDANFTELKQFIDLQITAQNERMTSGENLLLEALDSITSMKDGAPSTRDPVAKLNQDGTAWLCNSLKSLQMMRKLVDLKPTKWTKELLFQYFEIMEQLQENLHERQEIVKMMDEWIMAMLNKDDPRQQPRSSDRTQQLKQMLTNRIVPAGANSTPSPEEQRCQSRLPDINRI